MIISLLVAMDEKGAIGVENRLPWRLSDDLRWFKELTMGHHIIMGRRTYESIGRLLPGRTSIIVSRTLSLGPVGAFAVRTFEAALQLAQARDESEAFVIGGAEIFRAALPFADRIYLTRVHAEVVADIFFPPFDETGWVVVEEHAYPASDRNQYPFTKQVLERKQDADRKIERAP